MHVNVHVSHPAAGIPAPEALGEAAHRGIGDEVVAPEDDREAATLNDRRHSVADAPAGALDVDRHGGDVAEVDQLDLRRPLESEVRIEVDKAARCGVHQKREDERGFPDRLRTVAGAQARHLGRVEWDADHGGDPRHDVLDRGGRALEERVALEGQWNVSLHAALRSARVRPLRSDREEPRAQHAQEELGGHQGGTSRRVDPWRDLNEVHRLDRIPREHLQNLQQHAGRDGVVDH